MDDGGVGCDVLVVGAGPTGLTLAAQLRAFGATVRIVDKLLDRAPESRALAVQPRTCGFARTPFWSSDQTVTSAAAPTTAMLAPPSVTWLAGWRIDVRSTAPRDQCTLYSDGYALQRPLEVP